MVDTRYNSASAELEEIKRLLKRGDFDGARRVADKAAEGFVASGNTLGQIWVQLYHADIAFGLGAFKVAEEGSAGCLEAFTAQKSREGMGWASRNLQRCYCMLGQLEKSLIYGREALEIFDVLKDAKGASVAMRWMGVVHQMLGELETSRAELVGAMRHFYYASDTPRMLECVHDLSFLEIKSNRPAEALRLQKYLLRHTETPRWVAINIMPSIGRLEAQPVRLPDYEAPLDVLVPDLLSGRHSHFDPHSRVIT